MRRLDDYCGPLAPNGLAIVGTNEVANGTANINWHDDGSWSWEGTTDGFYDTQETVRDAEGNAELVDTAGNVWNAREIDWRGNDASDFMGVRAVGGGQRDASEGEPRARRVQPVQCPGQPGTGAVPGHIR
jgi:hypothetical protein